MREGATWPWRVAPVVSDLLAPPDRAATASPGIRTVTTAQQLDTAFEPPRAPQLLGYAKSLVNPCEPFHIVGPIYYVGTRGLAAYLIATHEGHILLDGGVPRSAAMFDDSIRKLGFRPEDLQLLLLTHAHVDHAGTIAHFKEISGARVAVMDRDFGLLASGGKSDPTYGKRSAFYFPPVFADRTLEDGGTVSLGGVRMVARLTAGHTPGSTTWMTTVQDGGRAYRVVFPCCTGVKPGCRLVMNPTYPRIADDYRRSFQLLQSLHPDVWLPAHTQSFGFEEKRRRSVMEGVQAWVDPEGYRRWLANEKATFEKLLAKETAFGRIAAHPPDFVG